MQISPSATAVSASGVAAPKAAVRDWWNRESCGEELAVGDEELGQLRAQEKARYELEPYIFDHAKFAEAAGRDVLEIGVGMGADHLQWARAKPKSLNGVDLTPRAIEITKRRFDLEGQQSTLQVADAEKLPFADKSFDIVYTWGVVHHSPDTQKAYSEIRRVLRPGGTARVMIYQDRSLTGYMLWARYALMQGRLNRSLKDVCSEQLQGPGEKTYTPAETQAMFAKAGFSKCDIAIQVCHGDLLNGPVGARHRGLGLTVARAVWPRWFIKRFMKNHGLYLVITARA